MDRRLAQYIDEQLKKGYSREQITSALQGYGYAQEDIEGAIAPRHKPVIWLIIALVIAGGVIYVIFSFLNSEDASSETTEIKLILDKTNWEAGETLAFTISVTETSGRVEYKLLKGSKYISSKTESFSAPEFEGSFELPSTLESGTYSLAAKVKDSQAAADFEVTALPKKEISVKEESPETVTLSDLQEIEQIVDIARDDKQRAISLCMELGNLADSCLLEAGLTVYDEAFCPNIKDNDRRDACYFNLVLVLKKGELCDNIYNENLKSTCSKM